jgi:iron(III) transport system substrate-binding protein
MAKRKSPLIPIVLAVVALIAVVLLWPRAESGGVVVYTGLSPTAAAELEARFEAATGIDAQIEPGSSTETIQRALAEREHPRGDVIWGIAGDQLQAYPELLADYRPPAWEALEPSFRVEGQRWLPYSGLALVFLVNTDLVAEDAVPTNWADLAREDLRDSVATARADKSGSSYMQLVSVLRLFPDRGWDAYRGILANALFASSSSKVPTMVADGEARVGLTLEDHALRWVQGGASVRIVYPGDGTVVAPDGIALLAGAPHPEQGQAFIDWALSAEGQTALVEVVGRRPVRTDVPLPDGLPPLSELTPVPYDFEWAAEHKDANLEAWTALVVELGL